jgi:hypothetical protein
MLRRGPPELPGLMGASVWRKSAYCRFPAATVRPVAERTPTETVLERPKGFPTAMTVSPIMRSSERPSRAAGKLPPPSIWRRARSISGAEPTIRAGKERPSLSVTWMSVPPMTTCSLVRMYPSRSMRTPEPREVSWAPGGGVPQKSSPKRSQKGPPKGFWTRCLEEM